MLFQIFLLENDKTKMELFPTYLQDMDSTEGKKVATWWC